MTSGRIFVAATLALLAAALAAGVAPARAQDVRLARMTLGYTYFNKPSATIADHDWRLALAGPFG